MRSIYSALRYCALALCAALGFSGMSYASESPAVHYARQAVVDVGAYGHDRAKFEVEQAYAVSVDSVLAVSKGGLVPDGNGYLQARADATVGQGVGNQVHLT